jgi:hypothetical protein
MLGDGDLGKLQATLLNPLKSTQIVSQCRRAQHISTHNNHTFHAHRRRAPGVYKRNFLEPVYPPQILKTMTDREIMPGLHPAVMDPDHSVSTFRLQDVQTAALSNPRNH